MVAVAFHQIALGRVNRLLAEAGILAERFASGSPRQERHEMYFSRKPTAATRTPERPAAFGRLAAAGFALAGHGLLLVEPRGGIGPLAQWHFTPAAEVASHP